MKSNILMTSMIKHMAVILAIFAHSTSAIPRRIFSPPHSLGLPPVPPEYDPDKDTITRWVSNRCTTDQLAVEAYGWGEAGVLSNALNAWKPEKDYQNAMDTYMGTDSSDNHGIFWSWRQRIQNAVTRNWNLHNGKFHADSPPETKALKNYLYIYCDEDESPYKTSCDGDVGAYTWELSGGVWWKHIYTVLCPNQYFDDKKMPTLASQLRKIREEPSKATNMWSLYWNKGNTYFHETFHWTIVTDPRASDDYPDESGNYVYGPVKVKDLAKKENTKGCSVIADAYAQTGNAFLLMQLFKLKDPPQPGARPESPDPRKFVTVKKAPPGWAGGIGTGDVNKSDSVPDPKYWQRGIKVPMDMDNYRPHIITPGTTSNPEPSVSKCGDHGYTAPLADVQNINQQLNEMGKKQCCTAERGGSTNIATSGKVGVNLACNTNLQLCVECARLANYVAGLATTCRQGTAPDIMVGGSQDIVETPGLRVEI